MANNGKLNRCPCELSLVGKSPFLTYRGPSNPKIIVIGEKPSLQDDKTGKLFSGEGGNKLRRLFKKVGIDNKQVGYTNVVSCYWENKPKKVHVLSCNTTLLKTIKQHSSELELVILVGNLAVKTILQKTGMDKLVGKIHRIGGVYHLPMQDLGKKQSAGKLKQEARDLQKAIALLTLDVENVINWEFADSKRLKELIPTLLKAKKITFDVETSSLDMNDPIQFVIGVGMCYDVKNRKGFFVPLEHSEVHITATEYKARIKLLKEILLNKVPKEGFNGGFDLSWCYKFLDVDMDDVNYCSDSMHEYHFVNETAHGGKLENLTLDYLPDMGGYDAEIDVLKVKHGVQFSLYPLDKIARYCVGDCIATARLSSEVFDRQLKKEGSWNLYKNTLVPVIPIYAKMSLNGIFLDTEYCSRMEVAYADILPKLRASCLGCKVVQDNNPKLDLDSPAKMVEFLYITLRLPEQKEFKLKAGIKQWVLTSNKLAIETLLGDASVSKSTKKFLVEFRDYSKVVTTNSRYASAWRSWVGVDGLVHPSYNVSGTVGGRLSMSGPNLQQLSRTEYKDDTVATKFLKKWPVRRMLISRFPNGKIVECDYSQLELRLMGALSNDKIMVGTYRDGLNEGDLHRAMAIKLHPDFLSADKTTQKAYRTAAKVNNFKGGYSLDEVFLSVYTGLKEYVDKVTAQAIAQGWIATIFGRRRRLPNLKLPVPKDTPVYLMSKKEKNNFYNRLSAIRQAVNITIQSPGHEIIEKALVKINGEFIRLGLKSLLILENHDAFLADCVPEEVEIVGKILQEQMESITRDLDWLNGIPLVAEPEVGTNWAEKTPL